MLARSGDLRGGGSRCDFRNREAERAQLLYVEVGQWQSL